MGAPPPLMTLRDLLELACESSCSQGFRSYPRRLPWHGDVALRAKEEDTTPVRLLIEADLRRSPSRTLSSILFPRSPASVATISRLTRSLSRRLVFWRRHRGDSDDGGSDVDERDSLGLPSPVVSSCSASECSESVAEAADVLVDAEAGASDRSENPSPSTSSGSTESVDDGIAAGPADGHKVLDGDPVGSSRLESMEDKPQLSPVSVMDFPFHDEDDGDERSDAGTCSPSFQQRQLHNERSTSSSAREPLLHEIRRLDVLPAQAAVDPVVLEPRFVASSEPDDSGVSVSDDTQPAQSDSSSGSVSTDQDTTGTATSTSTTTSSDEQHPSAADDAGCEPDLRHRLLARVLKDDDDDTAAASDVTERLLLDFFSEGLHRQSSTKQLGPVVGTVVNPSDHEPALVRAASEWVQGAGTRWGVEDVLLAGPAALADMDRERRWMCAGEEEREVGAEVEGLLVDALVAELVRDMAARC